MPSPTIILAILLALAVAGDALLAKLYTGALKDVARIQQAYDSFKAQVKVEGEEAQKKAKVQEMANQLRKDTADAEHKVTVAALTADIAKLRHDRDSARGDFLPPAPSGSSRPDLSCYDRAALESALGGFIAEVRGFADEGAAATVDLNTAKSWAQARP